VSARQCMQGSCSSCCYSESWPWASASETMYLRAEYIV